MTGDQKLAMVFRSLNQAGIDALVMGGHAVRYYGIDRNTVDFDMVTSIASPQELRTRLPMIEILSGIREQPAWRHHDFARFEIGKLADGREELLEFWLRNHLLDDFKNLKARAEIGSYGGESVSFLSLADLMKSKETERETDWQDIALLEEIRDQRSFAQLSTKPEALAILLSSLRSRRGMDRAIDQNLLSNSEAVAQLKLGTLHTATCAFLFPALPKTARIAVQLDIEPTLIDALGTAGLGTSKHFALVEVCRRAYKRKAMERDRADKQARLSENREG